MRTGLRKDPGSYKKKILLGKNLRLGIILLSIFTFILTCWALILLIKYFRYTERKVPSYSYENKSAVNYTVDLKSNKLYEIKKLGEGNIYITDYVDKINTVFKYQFTGERPAVVQGRYSVTAIVSGLLEDEKGSSRTVWEKSYILQGVTNFSGNDKLVTVGRELPISLTEYNDFAKQAIEDSDISFKTRLTIKWNISAEAATDKGIVKMNFSPTMEIPLNTKYFEIGGNLLQQKKDYIEETQIFELPGYKYYTAAGYGILALSVLVMIFMLLFTAPAAVDPVSKQLKSIFKAHGDRVVYVSSRADVIGKAIVGVESIESLVRLSDDTGKPILYNEKQVNNKTHVFYVIDDSTAYVFYLGEG